MNRRIIGIDLGTSSSAVAIADGGSPRLIPDGLGRTILPSLVVIRDDRHFFVGHEAAIEARKYSGKNLTIGSLKRAMDRSEGFRLGQDSFSPQILTALILAELKVQAEMHLGEEITRAVIAVPASFGFFERQFTKEAALIAGLHVLRIMNESTAAVCMLSQSLDGMVIAADLGAGTFDVSALVFGDGVFEVKATSGDDRLGGDDFTEILTKIILQKAGAAVDLDFIKTDTISWQRVRDVAEETKHLLSGSEAVEARIPFVRPRAGSYESIVCTVHRSEFEAACKPLLDRIDELVEEVWRKVKGDARSAIEIHHARSAMEKYFQAKSKNWFRRLFSKQAEPVTEASPLPTAPLPTEVGYLGIWLLGNASRMPAISERLRRNYLVKPAGLDLKGPVALGAAKVGAVLNGTVKDLLLLDVVSHSLGTRTEAAIFEPFILRDTTIPIRVSKTFTTVSKDQTSITVPILEKVSRASDGTRLIGTLRLEGILRRGARDPQIEVVFDVDANGVLHVSAKDSKTDNLVKVTCNDRALPEKTINQYHRLVQEWIKERRRR